MTDIEIRSVHDRLYIRAITDKGSDWLMDNLDKKKMEACVSMQGDLLEDITKDLKAAGLEVDVK